VAEPANCDLLLSTCFTVWLKTSPQQPIARVAAQGDQRPMAGNREVMDDLRRILTGREALYAQADAIVDTAVRSIEQSLNTLARVLQADQPPERTP
jgi:XRE family aerobic/anaerobic benzoate catabolism transcriptional regulator